LTVDTAFIQRLRDERAFNSPAALADQLREDRSRAMDALNLK
jgi:FAD synthase